jgi:hypothetical protein
MRTVKHPRFFIYSEKKVKEVTENEYYDWTCRNWHPSHLKNQVVTGSRDEVWLGFQGHYKYTEWTGRPFNVTYFVYGNDIEWAWIHDEYYATYEEAFSRFEFLAKHGYSPVDMSRQAA